MFRVDALRTMHTQKCYGTQTRLVQTVLIIDIVEICSLFIYA